MDSFNKQLLLLLCLVTFYSTKAAKIVLFSSLYLGDEKEIENTFARVLVSAGHSVTVYRFENSIYRQDKIKGVTINYLKSNAEFCKHPYFTQDGVFNYPYNYSWILPRRRDSLGFDFMTMHTCQCQILVNDETFMKKVKRENYDLALVNIFFNECSFVLTHLLNIPTISYSSIPSVGGQQFYSGVVELPAVFPTFMSELTGGMRFTERIYNVFTWLEHKIFYAIHYSNINSYVQKLYPELPAVQDLLSDTALLLTTTDLVFEHVRATTRNVVPLGCMTCREAKELPKHTSGFLNRTEGKNAIVINFGYLGNSAYWIPVRFIHEIERLVNDFTYEFVMKFEYPVMSHSLVILEDTITPLQDVLGHPNVALLISACSVSDLMEATYHNIPVLCIPVTLDQGDNAARLKELDLGRSLELRKLAKEDIVASIKELLLPENYTRIVKNMQVYSKMWKEDVIKPQKIFLHHVDKILQFKDMEHLKLGNRKLNIFQYYSCDVVLMVFLIFYTIRVILKYFVKLFKWALCSKKQPEKIKKQ